MPNLVPVSLSLWAGIYQVLFALRVGAGVVLMDHFDTATFAALVRRFGIRSTVLPPGAMVMLTDDETIGDLAPLRYVRSISAPLSPFQARRFRDRFGISVLNGYGQTEIGGEVVGWGASDIASFGDTKLGSVGRPHEGVTVRIVGADGAPPGEGLVAGDPVQQAAREQGARGPRRPLVRDGLRDGGDHVPQRRPPGGGPSLRRAPRPGVHAGPPLSRARRTRSPTSTLPISLRGSASTRSNRTGTL